MMEEQLTARLLASAALEALIADRFNWLERPEGEPLGAITATLIDPGTDYQHEGKSSLQYATVQFDCWGKDYLEVKQISRALATELEAPYENDEIVFEEGLETRNSDMKPERTDGGSRIFRVLLEFTMPFRLK